MSGNVEIIEMDRMRRLIADHMVNSKHTSPHVTSFVEVDVTNIVNWRERNKRAFQEKFGEKITYTPIFIEAIVRAIHDFPMINVSVNGNQIIRKKNINIGMAAALPSGNLIVPVIKKADRYSLLGLTEQVNDLAGRARQNKLKPEEIQGGTFTLTNVGTFGNVMGTPIINQPQVAILAAGAIRKKPAVVETEYGDMIAMGILDPTKVTRTALQNASSVAGLMVTTEAMVADLPKDEPPMPGGDMGGMGGMGGMM